jgi:hypothetical protein
MAGTIVAFTFCAFRVLLDGTPFPPPPPGMEYTPGPFEAFFAFMLGYLLFVMLLLLLLPENWPVLEIAFGPKQKSKEKSI